MSMFVCARCRELRDSDDGAEERGKHELLCVPCADQDDDPAEAYANAAHPLRRHDKPFTAKQQALIDKWETEGDGEGP